MPIVQPCSYPGCETLTMGELCVEHEPSEHLTGILRNLDDALEAAIEALHEVPSAQSST